MSIGELLLTLCVALIVFGPNKLPMLASHIGKLLATYKRTKDHAVNYCQAQTLLAENEAKAKNADTLYLDQGENHD